MLRPMAEPTPRSGLRVLLERAADLDAGAAAASGAADGQPAGAQPVVYRGAVLSPSQRFDFCLRIASDASLEVDGPQPALPGPEAARALELLRATARTMARRALADHPPSWPRRILRWRPAA